MRGKTLWVAAVAAGVLATSGAFAQWAPPGPGMWGPGGQGRPDTSRTQTRQGEMTRHGWKMDELERMFDGQSNFNRGRALTLAREIEAGAGEALWKQFEQPGSHGPSTRITPRILADFDTFKEYAEVLKSNAGSLASALEAKPTPQEVFQGRAMMPRGSTMPPPWAMHAPQRRAAPQQQDIGAVDLKALQAFAATAATCEVCHMVYRGRR
ncbi:MAG: cytochrome c [Alphaproteobacteria bacterium]|nr:cytochrome c [Alphaproteobacteria bacterium]MBF0249612.1 cytochrome c [Alphaproteobacteria bacterium]